MMAGFIDKTKKKKAVWASRYDADILMLATKSSRLVGIVDGHHLFEVLKKEFRDHLSLARLEGDGSSRSFFFHA